MWSATSKIGLLIAFHVVLLVPFFCLALVDDMRINTLAIRSALFCPQLFIGVLCLGIGPFKFWTRAGITVLLIAWTTLIVWSAHLIDYIVDHGTEHIMVLMLPNWRLPRSIAVIALLSFFVLLPIRCWLLRIENGPHNNQSQIGARPQYGLRTLLGVILICALTLAAAKFFREHFSDLPWFYNMLSIVWCVTLIVAPVFVGLGRRSGIWATCAFAGISAASAALDIYVYDEPWFLAVEYAACFAAFQMLFVGSLTVLHSAGWRIRGRWQSWPTPWRQSSGDCTELADMTRPQQS